MECKIIIFKIPRVYCNDSDIYYDEDEVKAICDYESRWEAIDHLLKDDLEYQEHKENHLDIIIDRDGFIRSNYLYTWWGYCLRYDDIKYL